MIIVKHIVFLFIYAVCHHCLIKGVPYGCNHIPFGCENFAKNFSKFFILCSCKYRIAYEFRTLLVTSRRYVKYKRNGNNISFWYSRTIGFSMAAMMISFRLFQKIPKGIWIFNRFFKAKQIEIKQRTWFKEKCSLLNDENCPLVVIYRRLSQYYLTMSWPRLKTGLHFM